MTGVPRRDCQRREFWLQLPLSLPVPTHGKGATETARRNSAAGAVRRAVQVAGLVHS